MLGECKFCGEKSSCVIETGISTYEFCKQHYETLTFEDIQRLDGLHKASVQALGQVFKLTYKPENVKLVFYIDDSGNIVYDKDNPTAPHPNLFEKFKKELSQGTHFSGRVAEYKGKRIVEIYGSYDALSLGERIRLKRGILGLILKRFVGPDAIVVDGKGEEIKFYP